MCQQSEGLLTFGSSMTLSRRLRTQACSRDRSYGSSGRQGRTVAATLFSMFFTLSLLLLTSTLVRNALRLSQSQGGFRTTKDDVFSRLDSWST